MVKLNPYITDKQVYISEAEQVNRLFLLLKSL